MCLTTVLLYKHGIISFTWIESDFVNQIQYFLKNVQEREFSENRFSQRKMVGLGLLL